MPAKQKALQFDVSSVSLKGSASTQEDNQHFWRAKEHGKVLKIVNPIFQTSRLQRQHKLELRAKVNSGTWKEKAGAGMRVEICEWNHASLDSKAESDSEESNSSDDYMFGMFDSFGAGRRKKSQQPRLRLVRAIHFKFEHVHDPQLIEQSGGSTFGPKIMTSHNGAQGSSEALSYSGSAGSQTGLEATMGETHVIFGLTAPLRCFEEPRDAEDPFMRPCKSFVGSSRKIKLGFACDAVAAAFLAQLNLGMREAVFQKCRDEWVGHAATFHAEVTRRQAQHRLASVNIAAGNKLDELFALAPLELAGVHQQLATLPARSFAKRAIRRWNLLPPCVAVDDSLETPSIFFQSDDAGSVPGLEYSRFTGLDALWQRYFECRLRDEEAFKKDGASRKVSSWDTGDGEVPRRKRFEFTLKLRVQLAAALTSTHQFTSTEAVEISSGLFVHHFCVSECCDEDTPRSVELCVCLYSHAAEPSALRLRYHNHFRARMSFTEAFNDCVANMCGLAAVRKDLRKGLDAADSQSPYRWSIFLRGAKEGTISLSSADCLDYIFPGERMNSISARSCSESDTQVIHGNCNASTAQLNVLLSAVIGELHPFFQSPAASGRKPHSIILRTCGLYLFPIRKMPNTRRQGKNLQASGSDGALTDGEDVKTKLASPQPYCLCDPVHKKAIAGLPADAQVIIIDFLRANPLHVLRPGFLMDSIAIAAAEVNESMLSKPGVVLDMPSLQSVWRNKCMKSDIPPVSPSEEGGQEIQGGTGKKAAKEGQLAVAGSAQEPISFDRGSLADDLEFDEFGDLDFSGDDLYNDPYANNYCDSESDADEGEEKESEDLECSEKEAGDTAENDKLMLDYLQQEVDESWEKYGSMHDDDKFSEFDQVEALTEYEEADFMLSAFKKRLHYTKLLASADCGERKPLCEWKLAKYKAKVEALEAGEAQIDYGSDDSGLSICSSDLEEEEPTAAQIEEKAAEISQRAVQMDPLMQERLAKMKAESEEMRKRSPERMQQIEEDMAREEEESAKAKVERKRSRLGAMAEIRRSSPLLWSQIRDDRKLHREKRVRMGRQVGTKYCDLDELLASMDA